ncbi:FadR/GntR family transcriptional regulator [Arthrobacter sp. Marseille-P9274]|uniref:FadR/GntR family transcriptional regulator n=1 Tax=Arthrobacter sp. Marseille-P9274 TaxID=2866572 RepID=UPI0021CA0132|nr:FCD domain-containing protein [Arthrobacter sp. Marseille-P9274]
MQTSLRPQKTAVLVAKRIVADIQQRGNKPGDRLPPERVMLEEYNIGRGTLRESLRFLELQGIIVLKPGPGGGPVVQQPDGSGLATALTLLLQFENAPFRTITEARTALEPMMAQLAALRMGEEQLAELKYSVDHMLDKVGDESVFLEMNKRFHDIIAHNSGNALFGHLIDTLLGMLDGTAIGVDYPEHRRVAVHKAHAAIYEALAAKDPTAAASAMHDHIIEYANYVERKFPEVLNTPISWTL